MGDISGARIVNVPRISGGKFRFRIQDGRHRSFFLHPFSDGGLERAQADADRTEVHALIDFQGGVEPVSFLDMISCTWSVTTASRPQPKELSSTSSRSAWRVT